MIFQLPTGFATTAHAFHEFLQFDNLAERISRRLAALDTEDVRALAAAGTEIRDIGFLASEAKGRGFDSRQPHQFFITIPLR